jgi:hypothetical protein
LILRLLFREKLQNLPPSRSIWRFSQELAQTLKVLSVYKPVHRKPRGIAESVRLFRRGVE